MGFKSYKSLGSQNLQNAGSKISAFAGVVTPLQQTRLIAGGSGGNAIALSSDKGVTWTLPNNQPFVNGVGYGRCAFNGKRVVMGGESEIAYSDDFGVTWVSTNFNLIGSVYKIIYIASTKMWFAVGGIYNSSNNTNQIARSTDGSNWTIISNNIFNNGRCRDIIYNGSIYIAIGISKNYPTATSPDGTTWTLNTAFALYNVDGTSNNQVANSVFNDGTRYILGCNLAYDPNSNYYSNIFTSQDCITWDRSVFRNVPFHIFCIAYNGTDTYVVVGGKRPTLPSNTFYWWSNDLINFYPANNNLLGIVVEWVEWNGTYFVACCSRFLSGSTTNMIYSQNGKDWTASANAFTYSYGTTLIP